MNNSPFEVFRRNLKPLMVFLTGLALFAFVVLPVLDQYMRQNAGTGNEQVLATFDGQNLTRERVAGFTRGHRTTLFFLQDLADRTIKNGRTPQIAGFEPGQNGQAPSFGINPEPSDESSIRTFVFAGQAAKQGFALSNTQLSVWLEKFCDGLYSEQELNSLAKKVSSNRINLPMIKEQLRLHMLAQVFINRGYAGLRVTTPDQTWRSFKKLNQKATANTYEVLVSDYMDEAKKLPINDAEISELYTEGKTRFPNPLSSEPGFRRRYAAKFQYVTGSAQNFMADEISKLTEEELRAEFQRRQSEKLLWRESAAAEEKAAAEKPAKETSCRGTSYRETSYRETSYRETSYRETSCRETSCREASCREASCREASCRETSCRETSCRETSCRETSCRETSCRETSCRETSCRETSCRETSCRETSCR